MKSILLASALMITGTAFAQADPRDAGQPIGSGATLTPGSSMGDRDTMGKNAATVTADGQVTTPQREDAAATAAAQSGTSTSTTTTMQPGTTMTDPATGATSTTTSTDTTTGMTGTTGTTGSGTMQTQTAGNMTAPPEPRAEYPRCSRTVTDNCVQSEARARDTKRTRR